MSVVGIAMHFLAIFTVCKFAFVISCFFCEYGVFYHEIIKKIYIFLLFRNNRVATLHVTQPGVKPQARAYCWRQKLRLETSLRFIIACFAKLGDLDEISQ